MKTKILLIACAISMWNMLFAQNTEKDFASSWKDSSYFNIMSHSNMYYYKIDNILEFSRKDTNMNIAVSFDKGTVKKIGKFKFIVKPDQQGTGILKINNYK